MFVGGAGTGLTQMGWQLKPFAGILLMQCIAQIVCFQQVKRWLNTLNARLGAKQQGQELNGVGPANMRHTTQTVVDVTLTR